MPVFSIVVPCRNVASTLSATLESVLAQTFPDWECLLVDDGSSDRTPEIMQVYCDFDARFRMLKGRRMGPSVARNLAALEYAVGEYIAFLDGDDLWHPERLAACFAAFNGEDPPELLYTTVEFFADDPRKVETRSRPSPNDLTALEVLADNPICTTSNIVVVRANFCASGGFDSRFIHCEDQEWLARFALSGARLRSVARPLLQYRTSTGGLSADLEAMRRGFKAVIASSIQHGLRLTPRQHRMLEASNLRYLARRALRVGTKRGLAFRLAFRGLMISAPAFLLPIRRGLPTLLASVAHGVSPTASQQLQRILQGVK